MRKLRVNIAKENFPLLVEEEGRNIVAAYTVKEQDSKLTEENSARNQSSVPAPIYVNNYIPSEEGYSSIKKDSNYFPMKIEDVLNYVGVMSVEPLAFWGANGGFGAGNTILYGTYFYTLFNQFKSSWRDDYFWFADIKVWRSTNWFTEDRVFKPDININFEHKILATVNDYYSDEYITDTNSAFLWFQPKFFSWDKTESVYDLDIAKFLNELLVVKYTCYIETERTINQTGDINRIKIKKLPIFLKTTRLGTFHMYSGGTNVDYYPTLIENDNNTLVLTTFTATNTGQLEPSTYEEFTLAQYDNSQKYFNPVNPRISASGGCGFKIILSNSIYNEFKRLCDAENANGTVKIEIHDLKGRPIVAPLYSNYDSTEIPKIMEID